MTAVADDGRYRIIPVADSDLDERGVVITYSVLERVFDEYDQQQGRDGHFIRDRVRIVETDVDAAVVADAHQLDVVLDELDVFFERYGFAARFVENVPHHLGQFDNSAFRIFGIYVDQGVNIVERIHEEMGIDLVSQIIHFRLQVLTFELLHLLFVAQGAVQQFDTHVQTRHEESQQDVPVDRQIGERRFAIQNVRLGVVRNVFS